jgi:hypothetical protein
MQTWIEIFLWLNADSDHKFDFLLVRAILLKLICERILEFLLRTCRLDVYGILEFEGACPGSMRIEEPLALQTRIFFISSFSFPLFRATRPGSSF